MCFVFAGVIPFVMKPLEARADSPPGFCVYTVTVPPLVVNEIVVCTP